MKTSGNFCEIEGIIGGITIAFFLISTGLAEACAKVFQQYIKTELNVNYLYIIFGIIGFIIGFIYKIYNYGLVIHIRKRIK